MPDKREHYCLVNVHVGASYAGYEVPILPFERTQHLPFRTDTASIAGLITSEPSNVFPDLSHGEYFFFNSLT